MDNMLTVSGQMPSLTVAPDALGPFGAKGIGEHPILGPGPAIANAVANAAGVAINQIPITLERLAAAIDTAAN